VEDAREGKRPTAKVADDAEEKKSFTARATKAAKDSYSKNQNRRARR